MVFFKKPRIKAGLREKCTADRANNIREAYIMSSPGSTPKKRFHLAATVEAVLDYPLGIVGLFLRVSELRDSLFPCWHEHAERKGRYFSMEQAVWSIKKISCPTPGRVRAMQTCESVGQPPPPPKMHVPRAPEALGTEWRKSSAWKKSWYTGCRTRWASGVIHPGSCYIHVKRGRKSSQTTSVVFVR